MQEARKRAEEVGKREGAELLECGRDSSFKAGDAKKVLKPTKLRQPLKTFGEKLKLHRF